MTDISSTNVTVTYCERWNNKQKQPIFPMSEDEARARHDAGQLYTVVLGDWSSPVLVELFLKDKYVGVRWLEQHGKDALRYAFRLQDDGRLFLSEVAFNTVDDNGKVVESESTLIKPDGTVQVSLFNNVDRTVKAGEPTPGKDVAAMWEDVPAFGNYESIARRER